MIIIKKLTILMLLAPLSILAETDDRFYSGFDNLHSHFSRIQEEIDTMMADMFNGIKASFPQNPKTPTIIPSITHDDSQVLISMALPSIDPDKIEVKKMSDRNGEYVTVSIPDRSMEITITPWQITYSCKQEKKEEKTKDDKPTAVYYSYGTSHMQQTLPAEVSFDGITAEYKEDTLTIILPKVNPKKNAQVIPVVKK